jgi:hypothetical protein
MAFQNSVRKEKQDHINQTFTVYLLCHGEASLYVKEKAAQQLVLEEAVTKGLAPDSEETKCQMETVQAAVLHDKHLFDTPLSHLASIMLQRSY